jgi:cyclase
MYASDYRVRVPTLTFTASFTLHLGGLDFAMTHLPGHTLNSTLITIPQQGVVFTGDLVCEAGLPAFIEADTFAWIDAVRAIEAMDIRTIVPGHGKVCGKEMATTFRGWMEDLVGEVERRIDKGVSREVIAREVSYEDRIHIATGQSPGYPKHLIDLFMTKSIETIHDHILQRRARSG